MLQDQPFHGLGRWCKPATYATAMTRSSHRCIKEYIIRCVAPSGQSCFLVCDTMVWYSTATIR